MSAKDVLENAHFVLSREIQDALNKGYDLYWLSNLPWVELRAITYTYETGKVRTKFLQIFDLRSELQKMILTQYETGIFSAPTPTYQAVLEEAYWKKIIQFHPGADNFLDNVFADKPSLDPCPPVEEGKP